MPVRRYNYVYVRTYVRTRVVESRANGHGDASWTQRNAAEENTRRVANLLIEPSQQMRTTKHSAFTRGFLPRARIRHGASRRRLNAPGCRIMNSDSHLRSKSTANAERRRQAYAVEENGGEIYETLNPSSRRIINFTRRKYTTAFRGRIRRLCLDGYF